MQKWHKLVNKNSSECRKLCPALKISKREDPQTPSLMCPHPTTLPPSVITPLTLHSGGAEIRTGQEQTNRQQSLHHSIIYFSYLKPFFFLCAPNFPSCRLSAYFPLPRRRQSLSNPHNTTLQLSNLAQRSPCPCGFRQSNTRVRASVRARARTESVCERWKLWIVSIS